MSASPSIPSVVYDPETPIMDREQIDMLLMVEDGEDSTSLIRELFDLFEGESREKLLSLDRVCEANDLAELRRVVHFVAGSAGNLGLARLSAFYRAIERSVDTGALNQIADCASPIRSEFEVACVAFQAEFGL
ncbi:MAG: Hpt domain-containing protein [Opitutaceae bacterium]